MHFLLISQAHLEIHAELKLLLSGNRLYIFCDCLVLPEGLPSCLPSGRNGNWFGGVNREYYKVNFCKVIFFESYLIATKLFGAKKQAR
jgi:hypothetical protein